MVPHVVFVYLSKYHSYGWLIINKKGKVVITAWMFIKSQASNELLWIVEGAAVAQW